MMSWRAVGSYNGAKGRASTACFGLDGPPLTGRALGVHDAAVIRKVYRDFLLRKAAEGRLPWLARAAIRYGAVHFSALLRRPLAGPILGTLQTNYTCNLHCRICGLPERGESLRRSGLRELDTRGMLALIDGFAAIGTLGIGFTGGEPLLRPDLWELLAHCRRRGMLAHLNTNGLLLDREAVRRLLEAGVDSLNVSLDGATAATHERIRGLPGAFARTVAAVRTVIGLKRAAGSPLRVKIVMALQEENAGEVPDFIALAGDLGVDCVEVIPRQRFRTAMATDVPADPALLEKVAGAVACLGGGGSGVPLENSPRMVRLFLPTFRAEPSPLRCYAAWSSLGADCFGRVFPCVPYINWDRPFAALAAPEELLAAWRARGVAWRAEVSRCRACTLNCQAELNLLFNPFRRIRRG